MKPWKILGFALAISFAASSASAIAAEDDAANEVQFVRDVLPVLKSKCLACHGDDSDDLKGEFDFRSREAAIHGGESGDPGIVPGKPDESSLYRAATRTDDFLSAMPPKENDALSAEQLAALAKWIEQGAAWPDAERIAAIQQEHADEWSVAGGVRVATSGGLDDDWTGRGYKPEDLWAYRPLPEQVSVPDVPAASTPIDALLSEKMLAAEIEPSLPANRAALIRRVTHDLTGLPPTPAEVDAFLSDPAPDELAFKRVVDRLMASPRYAEQQARHWLDVVRYADSSGFANDYERGNAWRYRDYVVRSFDEDKPYDRFVQEQVAGDELVDAANEPGEPDPEALVAAGFLRMGAWELTGMEVEKIARQRFLDDVTDAVGQVFLGHMLQCARCHDHKFDPVPTRDYYAFQAAFATTQLAERPAPFLASENLEGFEERRYLLERRTTYQEELASLAEKKTLEAARRWYEENGRDASDFQRVVREIAEEKNVPPETLSAADVRARMQKQKVLAERIFSKDAGFEPADFGRERIARKGLERLAWRLERYEPFALSVYAGRTPTLRSVYHPLRVHDQPKRKGELEQTAILVGGDPFSPSQPVEPGVLSAVLGFANAYPQSASTEKSLTDGESFVATAAARKSELVDSRLSLSGDAIAGRRIALAEWIVSPENPLTPRVMANRLWQRRFGRGIAGNPNNFGATGKKPTHPELLDWLARRLVDSDWSMKALDREIVLSEAYRRSAVHPEAERLAALDPDGETYARFLPRRLDAEEIRDSALFVTGELNLALGGIPVRPVMNKEVAFQPRQVMGTFAEAWQPSTLPSQRNRRSIYVTKLRGLRDPFFEVFDAPSPELSCEARQTSTVAPQAFSLFNSEQSYSRAIALAHRLMTDAGAREAEIANSAELRGDVVDRAFRLSFGRPATSDEIAACLNHWASMTVRHDRLEFPRVERPTEIRRTAIEENTGENFEFRETLESTVDFVPDRAPADASALERGLAEVCLALLNSNEFVYLD
ncbi:MAG TPA: PSD1 and planctomycete cytochrome C domain-containing protein [Pirellulaceae bacterium]|jgi:mono/diheme cytochrome c family protein|nr:PSD1 and planctomycete cytochrome C domain-containing protein [Pirellulaceae bacterium]